MNYILTPQRKVKLDRAVTSHDFDANTILAADTDNTPAALTINEQRIVGRITSGNITGLTAAQVQALLGTVNATNILEVQIFS